MLGGNSGGQPISKVLFTDFIGRSQSRSCEVCGQTHSNEGNVLVTCKNCNLVVHQKCYAGEGTTDLEDYLCCECKSDREAIELWGENYDSDPAVLDCYLCPVPKSCLRAFKPIRNKLRKLGNAHVLCASYLPDARINPDVIDVTAVKESWQGWTATCILCKLKGLGSCSKCAYPDCGAWTHATCAASPLANQNGFELNLEKRTMLCPGHSQFASKSPELAQEFLRMISSTDEADYAADMALAKSKKKKKGGLDSSTPTPPPMTLGKASKRGAVTPDLSAKPQKPAKTVTQKPDSSWVNRRVCVFQEGFWGTALKVKRNKFVVALDDGKVQVERRPDELRLLPEREPGCMVCKSENDEENMLTCVGCEGEAHMRCLAPPLTNPPAERWVCDTCKAIQSGEGEVSMATAESSAKKGKKPNGKATPAKKRSRNEEEAGGEAAEEGADGEGEAGEEEEDENGDEDDEKRRRKTATPAPSKSAGKGSAKKALGGADDAFDIREENVEFDRLFPEFTAAMWADLFKEMEHVHRAEMVAMMSRFGPSTITEQLRKSQGFAKRLVSIVSSKIIHQELPAACIEGFVNFRMASGDALSEEEMNVLRQIWTVNDIKLDLNSVKVGSSAVKPYEISANPFQLESAFKLSKPLLHSTATLATTTTTTTTTTPAVTDAVTSTSENGSAMDVVEENGPSEVLIGVAQSAADQCADSLVPLDVQAILKACLDAHAASPLPDIQLFVKMFAETVDRLRLDCERVFSRARLPAFRARELFRKLESRLRMIRMTEPVAKGEWRKTPYPRRAYETINDYEPVAIPQDKLNEERNRVLKKLETSKTPQCDESEKCSQLAPYSLKANGFITDRPCLSRRVGCKASTIGKDQPLVLKRDVIESDAWGFDSATRKFIDTSLDYVAAIKTSQVQNAIVEGFLIKCVHAQKQEHAADMSKALDYGLQALEICLGLSSSIATKVLDNEEARLLVKNSLNFIRGVTILDPSHLVTPLDLLRGFQGLRMVSKMFELQIRPKGVGIRCQMKSGFKAGTFISRYLGELYAPWRWFERQDGVKLAQNKVGFKPALPDFYNIMLERHEDDPDGYDVLFVDPIVRGNFASRLCHSCDPNCATVVMAVNGKFVIAVYALRDVDYGEELTFDYSSVTEDETEFRAAICLCGSANCRGSFLFYAGTGAFASVIGTHHTFLDRVAILLLSSMDYEMLDESEEERLRKYGVGKSITGGLPLWMRKWASFILRFVDFERSQLAKDLLVKGTFTEESARLEAQGVAENRRQNVAITLDKLGYFLRNSESTDHPLRPLSEEEVVEYLWNGPVSVARRAIEAAVDSRQIPEPFEDRLNEFMDANPRAETHEDAKRLLLELKDIFWDCPINNSISFCESCGDILLMHALTDTWFTSSSYKGFKSPSVAIRNVDIGRDSVGTSTGSSSAAASSPNTFACSRNDLLAVYIGHNEDGGEFVVEKEDQADGAAASLPKYYVFRAQSLEGLVPIYVYRKLEGAGEDVVSLTPLQDMQRYLMRFAFFVFPSQAKDVLEPVKLQGYEGTEIPVFVLSEKNLKKCKFVEPTDAAAAVGEEETKLSSTALKVIFNEPKKYQSGFAWGQLVGWFKQTVSDPSASLSAERRGSLSLPDIESCFQKEPDVAKFNKSRKDMMKKIKEKPDGMWPVGWPYSFKNKEKIYGSPWFDDALDTARAGDFNRKNERCAVFLTIMNDHLSATEQQ